MSPHVDYASRFVKGGSFVLDAPEGIPAVWGDDDQVLWAEGEGLLLVGPPGTGKTTLAGQLVRARLGLADTVLGYTVTPTVGCVLYIAADRPQQARRALRRHFHPEDRHDLDDRLRVWEGPPASDMARDTTILAEMARAAKADTVFIDSLKDVALGLSDDEVGAGLNQAIQRALADGVEVAASHHQRKGQNGSKPKTLEDVYGSTWLAAGAGSVVLLWGSAGDLVVQLSHLKQPASPVGPFDVVHDHDRGISTIERAPVDPLVALRNTPRGLTAAELAQLTADGREPNATDTRRAIRSLDRLVAKGFATREEPHMGGPGGSSPARFHAIEAGSR